MGLKTLIFVCFTTLLINEIGADLVPVLMWQNVKSVEEVPSISHVSPDTFKEILLQRINNNKPHIVIFKEVTLSPEDFSHNKEVTFPHLSQISKIAQVTYYPSVENPLSAVSSLPLSSTEVDLKEVLLNANVPEDKILIVDLNDVQEEENRNAMLRRHDVAITDIYNNLVKKHDNVLAILTGESSSWVAPNDVTTHRRAKRADNPKLKGTQSATGVLIHLLKGTFKDNNNNVEFDVSSVTIDETKITATLDNLQKLTMDFSEKNGYWYITKITYGATEFKSEIYASRGFSYACDLTLKSGTNTLQLDEFQIQVQTGVDIAKFGDAYYCVGFTSIPIWSGIFVTFLLLIILTIGLTMIMDIKTMDRFDDPKGKTIIVTANE
jgi:V-type H+-transporting ATPase S1 subunit